MRAALCILLFAAVNVLEAQVTRDVRAYSITGRIQDPLKFFWTNVLAGANVTIDWNANGTITINGGAGGGTNSLVLTNGVLVGGIGTINFIGATGAVNGGTIEIGGFSGGSSIGTSNISVMTNGVIVSSVLTNLNFVNGTNIFPMLATNEDGHVSIQFNLNPSLTNGFVGVSVTNGLATINYVDIASSNRVAVATHTPFMLSVTTNSSSGVMTFSLGVTNQNATNWAMFPTNVWNDRQFGSLNLTNWSLYSTNVIASTATNLTKYLSNLWGDVAMVLVPADGEVLKYNSAMGRWTNATDSTGAGGGLFNENQFSTSTRTNIRDGAMVTNIANIGILNVTNSPGSTAKIRIWHTNSTSYTEFTVPNSGWLPTNSFVFSITNPVPGQAFVFNAVSYSGGIGTFVITNDSPTALVGAAGDSGAVQFNQADVLAGTNVFTFDRTNAVLWLTHGNASHSPPNIILSNSTEQFAMALRYDGLFHSDPDTFLKLGSGNAYIIQIENSGGGSSPAFVPIVSSNVNLGDLSRAWLTHAAFDIHARRQLRVYLAHHDVNQGYFSLEGTNAVKSTNIFRLSITNPIAGQVFKFHNVQALAAGQTIIVLTNTTDSASAAGDSGDVQFNEGDLFAGTNRLTYDRTTEVFKAQSVRLGNNNDYSQFEHTNAVPRTNVFRFSVDVPVAGDSLVIHNVETFGTTNIIVITNKACCVN